VKEKILVVDIGGSHVKIWTSPTERIKFNSGADMRPRDFTQQFKRAVRDLKFDKVSIGFPAVVRNDRIMHDPKHLGEGWAGFNFRRALGKPVRVINDASMQALGSHVKGRTLFLGLGTGLGSALVWENNVLPLELGDLPYRDHRKIEDWLGKPGLERLGKDAWRDEVRYAVSQLKLSFIADVVVLGGGNVKKMDHLPEGVQPGDNRNAYLGGCRLWEVDKKTGQARWQVL
jgi:predicted NBD/HSP70 family sugar kinase